MKLIRLKSDNNTVFFNNTIQSSLILPPSSRIALQNLSFEKKDEPLVIDSTNQIFKYTMGSNTEVEIRLAHGIYTDSNWDDFCEDLEDKLNESFILANENLIGCKATVFDDGGRLNINYTQNTKVNIPALKLQGYENVQVNDTSSSLLYKDAGGANAADACIGVNNTGSYNYNCFNGYNGCGYVRVQLGQLGASAPTNGGYFIGLSKLKVNEFNNDFAIEKFEYAIHAKGSDIPYEYIVNFGAVETSSITPQTVDGSSDCDVLEIAANQGDISLNVYSTAVPGGTELVYDKYTEIENNLYPYLVFYTQAGNNVQLFEFTPYNQDDNISPSLSLTSSAVTPPEQDVRPRDYTHSWANIQLANKLGFFKTIYSLPITIMPIIIRSDRDILFVDNTECYLIELLNLNIESYDASLGQQNRRNLLAVIQNGRTRDQKDVYYDANTPLFIDLNNAYDIPMHNIQLRILDSSEQIPEVEGFSNMTILIE